MKRWINFDVTQYVCREMSEGQVVWQQEAGAELHKYLKPLQLVRWLRDWNVGQYVYYRLLGYVDAHLPQVVEILLELHYVLRGLQQILGNVLLNSGHVKHQCFVAQ